MCDTIVICFEHKFFVSGVTSFYDSRGNVRNFPNIRMSVLEVLVGIGMIPALPKVERAGLPHVLSVLLDGRVVGFVSSSQAVNIVAHLRRMKVSSATLVCIC